VGLLDKLDKFSSSRHITSTIYISSVGFFFIIVFFPPLLGILTQWTSIFQIFEQPELLARAQSAIFASFAIALGVSALDIVAGLPLAWLIARQSTKKYVQILDTMADIPFVIPTVALGYSVLLFWSREGISAFTEGVLISPGWMLIALLHFAFSYPVVVRVMVGALQDYERTLEVAARTLGASSFTAIRTVSLSVLKPSLVSAFILAFARSLSETGATVMVAGTFENGTVFIKNASDAGLVSPLVFVSFVLIVASTLIFVIIQVLGPKLRIPVAKVWPNLEKQFSIGNVTRSRDLVTLAVFLFFVIIPSLFVALPGIKALLDGTLGQAVSGAGIWSMYWRALSLSYLIAFLATLLNVATGLPLSILIARKRVKTFESTVLDAAVNVPIIVPSIALGVSLRLFWGGLAIPEFWILVLSHTTVTYTYFVRSMISALQRTPPELEEVARTLGGKPLTVFRKVTLSLTKYSMISGIVMAFTRSVDETGATLAVSKQLKTAPVLLVDWVKGTVPVSPSAIGLGVGILILTSFISLLAFKLASRRAH
jgi:thiamine transport system permease protein